MKLIYNIFPAFKGLKSKMAANLDKQNHFWYQINWCAILFSGLNLPKRCFGPKTYIHNQLGCNN